MSYRIAIPFLVILILLVSLAQAGVVETASNVMCANGVCNISSISCAEVGCCETYLRVLETRAWRIGELNCINLEGFSKVYINGRDVEQPTTVITDEVKLIGKCPTFIVGDKNSLLQNCRDTTINLTLKIIVLGGFTLFGGGVVIYLIVRKKKKSAHQNAK